MGKKILAGATGAFKAIVNGFESDNVTSVTLPDIERLTTEIKGAGVMGTINLPVSGQVGAMTVSISVRKSGTEKRYFMAPGLITGEIRIATDVRASNGELYVEGTRIYFSGVFTKAGSGKVEVTSTRDESFDYAITRYREVVDGEETILVDQLNQKFIIGGTDLMQGVRSVLG